MAKLRVTQTRSLIGRPKDQIGTIKALGLRRIRHTVEHEDRLEIQGMIDKVIHLVKVEKI